MSWNHEARTVGRPVMSSPPATFPYPFLKGMEDSPPQLPIAGVPTGSGETDARRGLVMQ